MTSIVEKSTLNPNAVPFVPAEISWFPVAKIPQSISRGDLDCVMLNSHEILLVPELNIGDYDNHECVIGDGTLYKYNVHRNEWNVYLFIDNGMSYFLRVTEHAIAFDAKSNKLYLADEWSEFTVIDINSKTIPVRVLTGGRCPQNPILVNVDGIIHKIGGYNNAKHLIWNNEKNELLEIYDFNKEEGIEMIYAASAVYVPSKGIIVMFGAASHIWKYCIATNEWKKVKGITFGYYGHSVALSSDEAYIVIAGGHDKAYNKVNMMHVLDIRDDNNYVLRKCSIKCPMSGRHKIVRSGGGLKDQLLVTGYIKQSVKSLPALDIINLIQRWYYEETIHWIQRQNRTNYKKQNHFVINIKQIIKNTM
eukprot:521817_1